MQTLKAYVARVGGMRLATHTRTRDRLVEMAVEEFPVDGDPLKLREILDARMRCRLRKEHGSMAVFFLLSLLSGIVSRIIVNWWWQDSSNQKFLRAWQQDALASANIQASADAEKASS
jgi:hypothetical protein